MIARSADSPPQLETRWLGRLTYDEAHRLQLDMLDDVIERRQPAQLLLLEHDPVVTLGRRKSPDDLRVALDELKRQGIDVRAAERGGQATYHGPGQLVGYLIAPVRSVAPDLPGFVWQIEEALLRTAWELGVPATRDARNHGVWVGGTKLASIGLAVRQGVSWHGFAFNVDPDLSAFELIRPCGLDIRATSAKVCVGSAPSLPDVAMRVAQQIQRVMFARVTGRRGTHRSAGQRKSRPG